jgi:XTP/dITP diphosphohydrolase
MLGEVEVEVVGPAEVGLDIEVVEDGLTFLANAQKKARAYAAAAGLPVIADDSGLAVDALNGEPGVYSARFGGADLSAAERNAFLLDRLQGVTDRAARYICVLCLVAPGGPAELVFMGQLDGRVGRAPRGAGGFGYDPVFELPDGRSMAMLDPAEKDGLSHRGRAVAEMLSRVDLAAWAGSGRPVR